MKKFLNAVTSLVLMTVLLMVILMGYPGIGRALSVDIADQAISYDQAFVLDVAGNNITYATAQADATDATPAVKTFTDGNISTGSITVKTLSALTTAYASNTLTFLNITGLAGASVSVGPVAGLPASVFVEGRDWRRGATTTTAATNLAAAMTAKIPGLTFSPSGNAITITANRAGTYYNAIPCSSNNSSATFTTATLAGGQSNAVVTIHGVALAHNKDWYAGVSSATAATSLAAAINGNALLGALLTATANSPSAGIVALVSDAVGADKNLTLLSSVPSALTMSGAAMTGGVGSAYTSGSSVLAVPAHGFNTGLPVLFSISGTASADPLVDQTTYYVSVVDANSIKLATTSARAVLGLGVPITATPEPVNTYTLTPLGIAGTASYKWQTSNDNLSWADLAGAAEVTISDYGTLPISTSWDFGNVGFHYIRLAVVAPTAGALGLKVNVNGIPLSEFVPSVGGRMSGQLSMMNAPVVLTGANGYINASSTITAPQFTGPLVGNVTGSLSGGAVSATTLTASGAGNVTGQFTWGAAGTKSTGTVNGSLTIPGTLTALTVSAGTVNVAGSGQVLTGNASSAALALLAPGQAKGALITNSTTGELCTSSGAVTGAWVLVKDITTACY